MWTGTGPFAVTLVPVNTSQHSLPAVSVIMPVLNEERHLAASVERVLAQDYSGPLDLVLAVGPSRDRTTPIASALSAADQRITVVTCPSGHTPEALNAALTAATGSVIVRVDAHSEIPADYVRTAIRVLEETGADVVGGVMRAEGTTPFSRAVAAAMTSAFGVGRSPFHIGGPAGEAESVYLGVFPRAVLDAHGGFHPGFRRAQDWELNHRIRAAGGRVWFSPELRVTYRPRSRPLTLARQYAQYGRWRRVVSRIHSGTLSMRYLAAPTMTVAVTLGTLLSIVWAPAAVIPIGYLLAMAAVGCRVGEGSLGHRLRVGLALVIMHWAWGIGFLTSPPSLARAVAQRPEAPVRPATRQTVAASTP